MNRSFIFVEGKCLTKYRRDELVAVYDCYIAEVDEDYGAVTLLGSDV